MANQQFSTYLSAAALNHFFRNVSTSSPAAVYLALYNANPTDADVASELSGGAYARQAITFGAPTGATPSQIASSAQINFPIATADWNGGAAIGFCGIRDALSAGNLLAYGPLTTPRVILTGYQLIIAVGNLIVTLD